MNTEEKRNIIIQCIADGNWGSWNDIITRADLMDYLIHESQVSKSISCPICDKNIKPYKVSFTHRSAKYLLSAIYLSDKALKEGGDGYVHHDIIKLHTEGNWQFEKGKKTGHGIVYTSYANLCRYPWDFLTPLISTNDKIQRNGEFKPTDKCRAFLRGELSIPLWIMVMNAEVIRYSDKKVNILTMKDVNFQQCIDLFRTFS